MDPKVLRMVGLVALVGAGGAGLYYFTRKTEDPKKEAMAKAQAIVDKERAEAIEARKHRAKDRAAAIPKLSVPLREFDHELFKMVRDHVGQPMRENDAMPDSPAKVTLQKENSPDGPRVRRMTIDLDRDGRIDEIWMFTGFDKVQRHVKMHEEHYTDLYDLDGDKWKLVQGFGATALMEPTDSTDNVFDLRPVDQDVLPLVGTKVSGKQEDALPGKAYRVNLYSMNRSQRVDRIDIDIDRDNKVDERWNVRGQIRRETNPGDDGKFTEVYVLQKDKWRKIR